MRAKCLVTILLLGVGAAAGAAQTRVQLPITNEEYTKPFPPVHIVGNVYYVGTYDLASYLITTPEGHVLVNTGLDSSVPMIRTSVEALGFRFADIKLLLATHGHWDHVAGMAAIKQLTGARMLMHEADAGMLEDGGNSDYRFPQGRGVVYEPVRVDQRLRDGDTIRLGGVVITALHHPGDTKGATSFRFDTQEAGRTYRVLIANMGSINEGVKLLASPGYPRIVEDYATTFEKQKQLPGTFDVWVSSHAPHFLLHAKYKPGDAYDPNRFVDPGGYLRQVQRYEQLYLTQLQAEKQGK